MRGEKSARCICAISRISGGTIALLVLLLLPACALGQDTFEQSLLLFRSDREGDFELYTMRGDGTDLKRLTFNSANEARGRFSPDRSRIVFVRNQTNIWLMNTDGTEQQFVTAGSWADFTPDGENLVVSAYGGSSYAADNLFMYDLSTQARTRLSDKTGDEYISDITASGKMAYWHYFFFQNYYANVHTMNLDGGADTALTFYDDWNKGHARNPRFSPDEAQIAYQDARAFQFDNIRVMNADGTNDRLVAATESGGAITPVWSPDGNYLIYADWVNNKSDIYIVGADGTGKGVFYGEPGNNYPLDWIALTALRVEGAPEEISLEPGVQQAFTFDVFRGSDGAAVTWTIEADAACPWIASITPGEGVSAGPADKTTVTVWVDTSGLAVGDYAVALSIDEGLAAERVTIPLKVFNRVNMEEFAGLSAHWGEMSCLGSEPCYGADWFVDGRIDVLDLMQFSMSWLREGVERAYRELKDGFETGDLSAQEWQLSGQVNWTVVSGDAHEGSYSARSGATTHNQVSSLTLAVDDSGFNRIRFARKTSSEGSFDALRFYIDGVEKGKWSGETAWGVQVFLFGPGEHTFRWSYSKDSSVSRGSDCAWIDSVAIYVEP